MPRKAKRAESDGKVLSTIGNYAEKVRGYFQRADALLDEVEDIMRDARERCQPHVDDLKQLKKDAADEGIIPKKVFAAKLRERSLKNRAEACRGTLSEQQQETFDQVSHALGQLSDTPLGGAVLSQHPDAPAGNGGAEASA